MLAKLFTSPTPAYPLKGLTMIHKSVHKRKLLISVAGLMKTALVVT